MPCSTGRSRGCAAGVLGERGEPAASFGMGQGERVLEPTTSTKGLRRALPCECKRFDYRHHYAPQFCPLLPDRVGTLQATHCREPVTAKYWTFMSAKYFAKWDVAEEAMISFISTLRSWREKIQKNNNTCPILCMLSLPLSPGVLKDNCFDCFFISFLNSSENATV